MQRYKTKTIKETL